MARSDPAMRILARELDQASLTNSDLHKKIERLRAPFRATDDHDWDFLFSTLGDGGRGRFWKDVMNEMRAALNHK